MLCLLAAAASAATAPADSGSYRRDYAAALEAARKGDQARYRALLARLDGYVLRGYVEYEYLKDRVDQMPARDVRAFLERTGHTPLAEQVRGRWLRALAARGDWKTFAQEYVEAADDPELLCLHLGRRVASGKRDAATMARIERLWLTGRRLPGACEPVFSAWRQAGHMTTEKLWERIGLAMEARNLSLASELASHLPARERVWVTRWQAMHRDPVDQLERLSYPIDTPVARMVVKHGIVRLAFRDPEAAMRQWERIKQRHQFFGEDEDYVLRYIGILAAQHHLPEALKWLSDVSVRGDDLSLQLWRVLAALRAGEWETAQRFIAALPEAERATPRWRYWRARVHELKGERAEARELYAPLARERDYYGFLAADRLGADYSMQHVPVEVGPEEVEAMLARPSVRAAQELYALGQVTDARRQWSFAIRELNNRELQVAAVVAREWGWYDRALQTVALSDHPHDLELRFPVLYRDVIEANAKQYGLDPGWIYGVVRQESGFVVDARSPAGAVGLMQLMPATGRETLRKLRLGTSTSEALLSVEHNVRLGVTYLKGVLERYGGHQVLATASYNAGPNRVASWVPSAELDADVWVETIPYNETRGYVKNVLAFAAVYDYRLGLTPTRLASRMPAVTPAP